MNKSRTIDSNYLSMITIHGRLVKYYGYNVNSMAGLLSGEHPFIVSFTYTSVLHMNNSREIFVC